MKLGTISSKAVGKMKCPMPVEIRKIPIPRPARLEFVINQLYCEQTSPVKPTELQIQWMTEALKLASECLSTGDVPVGAIVIDALGKSVGVGRNQREELNNPLAHAEIQALQNAAQNLGNWRLAECTLIVTLEPCTMCAGAIVNSRIKQVVFGADEPKTGAVGSLFDVIRDRRLTHQPEVVSGVLADESAELLRNFFATKRND
jgi:tRNA(adenine34) deaminase